MEYEKSAPYNQLRSSRGDSFVRKLQSAYLQYNILPLLTKRFSKDQAVSILEFGPGLGVLCDVLHQNFVNLEYTAVDVDDQVLARIKRKHPASRIIAAHSSRELAEQVRGRTFDAAVAIDVWEHIPPDELDGYTSLAVEMIGKRGVFVAQVPNWGCPFAPNTIFAGDLTHCNRFNELSARQLLLRTDIPDSQIFILPYDFPPINLLWRIRSAVRTVILLSYKLLLVSLGLYKVSIATPNLIMVVDLQNRNQSGQTVDGD